MIMVLGHEVNVNINKPIT